MNLNFSVKILGILRTGRWVVNKSHIITRAASYLFPLQIHIQLTTTTTTSLFSLFPMDLTCCFTVLLYCLSIIFMAILNEPALHSARGSQKLEVGVNPKHMCVLQRKDVIRSLLGCEKYLGLPQIKKPSKLILPCGIKE